MSASFPDAERLISLISRAIDALALDLSGMTVLTEAASGPFAATPLIAAMAGADKVIAVTRDSKYATANDVITVSSALARSFNCIENIEFHNGRAIDFAHRADLVTNLNFVRPLDKALIEKMPANSAISLMIETWEFRPQDVDLRAAKSVGVPVLGTNECDSRLMIFEYVGALVIKLLFEAGLEVCRSRCLLIASGHYGEVATRMLRSLGADVEHWDPKKMTLSSTQMSSSFWDQLDAVIVAEQESDEEILGLQGIDPSLLSSKPVIVHLCGAMNYELVAKCGLKKYPPEEVSPGYMTRTTGDIGPRPVVDLHAGGLKVGEAMVHARRQGLNIQETIKFALSESPAMAFSDEIWDANAR